MSYQIITLKQTLSSRSLFLVRKQSPLVFLDIAHFGFGWAEVQYHVTVGMTGDKKREYGYQDWSGIPVTYNIVIK